MRDRLRPYLTDIVLVLVLFLIPVLFFYPVTLGGKTLIPADNLYLYEPWASYREAQGVPEVPHNALLSDLVLQNYQWKHFIRQNIQEGEIPLWQPNQFGGTPFLANGQHSALYPFSIIYYLLPLESAYGWFTVSQLWLAGILMLLYVRGMGLGRSAGMIAAVGYQLSSFLIVATVHPMIQAAAAWLPLCLLMTEYILQQRPVFPRFQATNSSSSLFTGLPWALIGAVGLGMSFLAGHIEITYYTLLVIAIYALLRILVQALSARALPIKPLLVPATLTALMVIFGFGIGAVQFIPTIETANNSFRTERSTLEEVRGYALPPRHVALWLMPNFYGSPAQHQYFDILTGEVVEQDWTLTNPQGDPVHVTHTHFGIKNYVEGAAYTGIPILAFALLGIIGGLQRRQYREHIWVLVILGLLAVAFMFGTPLYAILYYLLPGVKQLHTPFRWIWIFTFVLCVLAAHGANTLIEQRGSLLLKRYIIALVGTGVAVFTALVVSPAGYGAFEPLVERLYKGLAGADQVFPNAKAFYSYEFNNIFIFALILVASGFILWVGRRSAHLPQRIPLWSSLAVGLLALDLFMATGGFNTAAEKRWLEFTPPSIQWLQTQEDSLFRIQTFDWKESPLNANSGWRYGLQDVRGYDSLFSRQYADYMNRIAPQNGLAFNRIDPISYDNPQALLDKRLDLLNVRYFVTDWIIRPQEELNVDDLEQVGLRMVYEDVGVRIYENEDFFPRAYVVSGELPTVETIQLEDIQPVTITSYEDTTVFVDTTLEQSGWLILGDTYAKGWRAFVRPMGASDNEEEEIPVELVLENFRGVQLEPGAWTIRFRYSPQSFQLGAFTSFISGMLMIFMALIWLWRVFVSEAADADSARRVVKNSLAPIILNLFNRGIDFAFAFIMLRILGPGGAGIYYYAIVIFGWFDILTNFGLNTLLTREVARDRSQAWNYLLNTSALRLGLAALGIPVLAIFLFLRNTTVSPALDETSVVAIILLYIGLIPGSISTGLSALFYAFEKAEYPAALATVSTLIKVSLGLGVLLLGWDVIGLAAVSVLTNFMTLIFMIRLAIPLIHSTGQLLWHISFPLMRGMMGLSWPLMLNHLLATVFFKSDIILMEAINGVVIVGIYSTAYKWLDALNIIPAFFTMALLPMMSRQAHEDMAALRRNYIFGFKSLVMVALPVAVITTFIAPGLIGVLGGREYLPEGGVALQIMIWSIPIGWINSLTQYVLIALDRQRQITYAFVVAVGFNIIGNLIFLPEYSYRAAAVITIFSELVLLIGFYLLLRRDLHEINFAKVLWRPIAAVLILVAVTLGIWMVSPMLAILLSGVIYSLALIGLKPLTAEESERLGRVMPSRLRRLMVR